MHKDLKRLQDGIFTHKPSLTTLTTALRTQYSMQAMVVSRERELKGKIIVEFGINRCHDRYYGGTQGPVSRPGSGQGSPLHHSDVLVSGAFGCTQSTEMKYDITEGADKSGYPGQFTCCAGLSKKGYIRGIAALGLG